MTIRGHGFGGWRSTWPPRPCADEPGGTCPGPPGCRAGPPRPRVVANEAFWEAVRRLPKRQAQCVALHYLEDRPVADVAALLDIAEATVRGYLHQGRAALAVSLDVHLGEEDA